MSAGGKIERLETERCWPISWLSERLRRQRERLGADEKARWDFQE